MNRKALNHHFLLQCSVIMGDAFYVFFPEVFRNNYTAFRDALRAEYKYSHVAYSLKANYMPAILSIINQCGGMAEAVSRLEYDIATTVLSAPDVIFNGPSKRLDDIYTCLRDGSRINIDSLYEIELIEQLSKSFSYIPIGIRFNSHDQSQASRFGFNLENGDLDFAVKKLNAIGNVKIVSIHSHYSSSDKSSDFFSARLDKAISVMEQLSLRDVEEVNLGGGYFGALSPALKKSFNVNPPDFKDYAAATASRMKERFGDQGPSLIIEPGISIASNSMVLIAKVIETKKMHGRRYVVLDTNINIVNPTRSSIPAEMHYVPAFSEPKNVCEDYLLVGNTCMEHDLIAKWCGSQPPRAGDFFIFLNRGAYSNNHTPPFITPPAGIIDDKLNVIKYKDDFRTILSSYSTKWDPCECSP